MSKVRGSSREEIPSVRGQGQGPEELLHVRGATPRPHSRGQGQRPGGATHPQGQELWPGGHFNSIA